MKFASLGSGSSGNCTLVSCGNQTILLDCGFSLKETEKRCARLGLSLSDITAILVTHEHTDHASGIGPVARKCAAPVYMTPGTYLSRDYGEIKNLHLIRGFQSFSLEGLNITPVAVPHDAKEPAQFIFEYDHLRLGVLTDVGSATAHLIQMYKGCQALLIEFNHDLEMLRHGPYPPSLIRRVASDWGHLNNEQAALILEAVISDKTQHVVAGHISQKNNSVEKVNFALQRALQRGGQKHIKLACQEEGFDWITLR